MSDGSQVLKKSLFVSIVTVTTTKGPQKASGAAKKSSLSIATVAEDENVPFWFSKCDVKLEDF